MYEVTTIFFRSTICQRLKRVDIVEADNAVMACEKAMKALPDIDFAVQSTAREMPRAEWSNRCLDGVL